VAVAREVDELRGARTADAGGLVVGEPDFGASHSEDSRERGQGNEIKGEAGRRPANGI
jgi:hypothetical protein